MSKQLVPVGIAGLGRSGWDIHAKTLLDMPDRYVITAVADPSGERRAEAAAACACNVYDSFGALAEDKHLDLIVVATPSHLHVDHTMEALRRGRHVVCEKPFALSAADADRAIAVAGQTDRIVAPFHNRRYEAHLMQVKQVIASGVLGQIVQIRISWHSFGRRWDWQTLKEFGGGALNNNGSHLIDHALQVFGDGEPQVFADMRRTPLTSGDAEDHIKVILYAPGHPTVDIELTSAAAYPQDRWHVMGTSGGLRGSSEKLEWKWVDFTHMPPRPVSREPAAGRAYNREKHAWQQGSWTKPADTPPEAVLFYSDLFRTLRHGAPLVITPQSVRRQIAVMEKCRQMCPI